jgi:hypothetical protein
MELTENERLLLVKKKEEISRLTSEIFDIYQKENSKNEVLKRITQVQNCLSILASYAPTNKEWYNLITDVHLLELLYNSDGAEGLLESEIRSFCYSANSITFEFTKNGINISIPVKVKELIMNKFQLGH